MSSVGRIRIDDCSDDRTLLVELTIIPLRRLRACLEGSWLQLPRFFANANLPAINRFLGFRFPSPQAIIPARLQREIFAPATFDEFPES